MLYIIPLLFLVIPSTDSDSRNQAAYISPTTAMETFESGSLASRDISGLDCVHNCYQLDKDIRRWAIYDRKRKLCRCSMFDVVRSPPMDPNMKVYAIELPGKYHIFMHVILIILFELSTYS